jgi:serine/threonine protein kinase
VKGAKSAPPELPGFNFVRWLGGGGFADVFLYRQRRPAREVAVKVLRQPAVDQTAREAFDAEADLMAQVSAHSFIVTVHAADVAPDGRPYLVMEYYSRSHLGLRAQQKPFKAADALRIGVQVASAVETAHRAGILHRDIKPANILVNGYGRPGLTDFGIAGLRTADGSATQAVAASLPFAAPEVVSGTDRPVGAAADVWSLAATVHTLLAGRSPFERGSTTRHELLARVLTREPNEIPRSDLPRSLVLLLKQGLNKDPQQRPETAYAFAQALQDIERQLHYSTTPIELLSDEVDLTGPFLEELDNDGTVQTPSRVLEIADVRLPRQPTSEAAVAYAAPAPSAPASPATPATAPDSDVRSLPRLTAAPAVSPAVPTFESAPRPTVSEQGLDTIARPPRVDPLVIVEDERPVRSSRSRWVLSGVAAVVLVAGIVGISVGLSQHGGSANPDPVASTSVQLPAFAADPPQDVHVRRGGNTLYVDWKDGGSRKGDQYRVTLAGHPALPDVTVMHASLPYTGKGSVCVSVRTKRGDALSEPAIKCR